VSSASDIFSLGIVFFELATGEHPFRADSFIGVLHGIVSDPAPLPARVNPEISEPLQSLILRMLEKEPRLRPSAAEVEAALQPSTLSLTGSARDHEKERREEPTPSSRRVCAERRGWQRPG
jgi:serine/threonine protein kinase